MYPRRCVVRAGTAIAQKKYIREETLSAIRGHQDNATTHKAANAPQQGYSLPSCPGSEHNTPVEILQLIGCNTWHHLGYIDLEILINVQWLIGWYRLVLAASRWSYWKPGFNRAYLHFLNRDVDSVRTEQAIKCPFFLKCTRTGR